MSEMKIQSGRVEKACPTEVKILRQSWQVHNRLTIQVLCPIREPMTPSRQRRHPWTEEDKLGGHLKLAEEPLQDNLTFDDITYSLHDRSKCIIFDHYCSLQYYIKY